MGSHQSSQVCRVVPGLSTPSPFNANHGTESRGKAPGGGLSRVMERPPRAPRSAQEVRCRPGRSWSPSFAGARRVNGNGGSPHRARRGGARLSGAGRGGSPSRARAGLRKPGREPHRRAGRARVNPSGPGGADQAQNPRIGGQQGLRCEESEVPNAITLGLCVSGSAIRMAPNSRIRTFSHSEILRFRDSASSGRERRARRVNGRGGGGAAGAAATGELTGPSRVPLLRASLGSPRAVPSRVPESRSQPLPPSRGA